MKVCSARLPAGSRPADDACRLVVSGTGDLYRLGHCGFRLCDVEPTSTPTVSDGDQSNAVKGALRRLRGAAMTRAGANCGAMVGAGVKRLRMRAGVASAIRGSSISQEPASTPEADTANNPRVTSHRKTRDVYV